MVRFLIPLGWLGVVVLLLAAYTGHQVVPGSDDIGGHLITALLSSAALLMVYLVLGIYLAGTRRLVRRSASAGSELEASYLATTRRVLIGCGFGAAPLLLLFASGLPTQIGRWEPFRHHALFFIALAGQLVALLLVGRGVGRSETILSAVAKAEYTDAPPSTPSPESFPQS